MPLELALGAAYCSTLFYLLTRQLGQIQRSAGPRAPFYLGLKVWTYGMLGWASLETVACLAK